MYDPRGVVCLQPPRAVVYSTPTGSGTLPSLFFLERGIP